MSEQSKPVVAHAGEEHDADRAGICGGRASMSEWARVCRGKVQRKGGGGGGGRAAGRTAPSVVARALEVDAAAVAAAAIGAARQLARLANPAVTA